MSPWMEELETLIWLGSLRSTKKRTEVTVNYVIILEEPWSPRRSCGEKACLGSGVYMAHLCFVGFLGRYMHNFIEGIIGITIALIFPAVRSCMLLSQSPFQEISHAVSLFFTPNITRNRVVGSDYIFSTSLG